MDGGMADGVLSRIQQVGSPDRGDSQPLPNDDGRSGNDTLSWRISDLRQEGEKKQQHENNAPKKRQVKLAGEPFERL